MVAANSQWLVPTICCTCNGNNPNLLNFESEICFLLKYFKDILASILKIMENVDIFFR